MTGASGKVLRVIGSDVRVVYTKYDGSLHWHQTMRHLGEDEHGVWLGAPAGLIARRGYDLSIVIEEPHLMLFPRDVWWTAVFNGAPSTTEIYCDISTPPRWPNSAEVTMVDLDLDVIRRRADQRVELVDEDEFAENQVRYGYPADVVRQAELAAAWLQGAIAGGAEPFAGDYLSWFDQIQPAAD
jgi:protein associated with RNAse G/E